MLTVTLNRFVLEVSLTSLYVALPFVGEVHLSREMGLTANKWDCIPTT